MPPQLADRTIDARGRDSVDLTGARIIAGRFHCVVFPAKSLPDVGLGPPVFPYLADSEGSFGVSL